MLWIIGMVWLAVVSQVVLDESIRFELWLGRAAQNVSRTAATLGRWMR